MGVHLGGTLEMKVPRSEKEWSAVINLHAMQQRRAMHHDDVLTCIHLRLRPLLEPIIGSEPLLHPFRENRSERMIAEDVVMLVHDHEVCVLTGVTNALKDAL